MRWRLPRELQNTTMNDFTYAALPQRVVFGAGTLTRVSQELDRLGLTRVLVLTTGAGADAGRRLVQMLGSRAAGSYFGAVMHTPVAVTEEALALVRARAIDGLVALGGGSTIGLSKAIAVRTDLPQIVIPTTYAGSEATPILGETENGRKTTRRDPRILPEVIVYDVDLTLTLPRTMTVTSGLNAIAHAVEARYARDRNPVVSALAVEGLQAMVNALPAVVQDLTNAEARSTALLGAWMCGTCLGSVGMALHHKICHVLGGSFALPHAQTHAVVLPHATAYNERAAAAELRHLAAMLGADRASDGLWSFARSLGAPMTLSELGMKREDLGRATSIMMETPYWNPQPVVADELRQLLENAFLGRSPATGFSG
jgi:maleylacetate reductase